MRKASSGRNLDANLENDANLEMLSLIYSFKLYIYMPRSKNSSGVYHPKYKKKRTSRLSRSASIRILVDVRDGYGRARGIGAAPRRRRSNEAI